MKLYLKNGVFVATFCVSLLLTPDAALQNHGLNIGVGATAWAGGENGGGHDRMQHRTVKKTSLEKLFSYSIKQLKYYAIIYYDENTSHNATDPFHVIDGFPEICQPTY